MSITLSDLLLYLTHCTPHSNDVGFWGAPQHKVDNLFWPEFAIPADRPAFLQTCSWRNAVVACPLPEWFTSFCAPSDRNVTCVSSPPLDASLPEFRSDLGGKLSYSNSAILPTEYQYAPYQLYEAASFTSFDRIALLPTAFVSCPGRQSDCDGLLEFGKQDCIDQKFRPLRSQDTIDYVFFMPLHVDSIELCFPENSPLTQRVELFDIDKQEFVTVFVADNDNLRTGSGTQTIEMYGNRTFTNRARVTIESYLPRDVFVGLSLLISLIFTHSRAAIRAA